MRNDMSAGKGLWTRVGIIVALCSLFAFSSAVAEAKVGGVIIVYGLSSPDEEQWQRIMDAPEVEYILCQMGATTSTEDLRLRRCRQATERGKKLIMQLWFGNWAKYSFPHLARDAELRQKFFADLIDTAVASCGGQDYLYGIHLLEEVGMQFGIDDLQHRDPWDLDDKSGRAQTSSYDSYWYSNWGENIGGPQIPNLLRYNAHFEEKTGLDLENHKDWNAEQQYVFNRWCSQDIHAEGQRQFFLYMKENYPKIKRFTWDIPYFEGENPRTDFAHYRDVIDGIIVDPYGHVGFNYGLLRFCRTVCPQAELIALMWGAPPTSAETRQLCLTTAYLAGASGIGFFGGAGVMDWQVPDDWQLDTSLYAEMADLPVFDKRSRVLLVSNHPAQTSFFFPRLKYYDLVSRWEANHVDLSAYDLVICHSSGYYADPEVVWDEEYMQNQYGTESLMDGDRLEEYVRQGGVLFLSGLFSIPEDSPPFIAKYLRNEYLPGVYPNVVVPGKYDRWWVDEIGLGSSYYFPVLSTPVKVLDPRVRSGAGYYFEHGKGAVYYFPAIFMEDNPQRPPDSGVLQTYRRFLNDVMHGILKYRGRSELAAEYLLPRESESGYLFASNDAGTVTAAAHLWSGEAEADPDLLPSADLQVKGRDIWSGAQDPILSKQKPSIIMKTEK